MFFFIGLDYVAFAPIVSRITEWVVSHLEGLLVSFSLFDFEKESKHMCFAKQFL